jgi:hypothetical protein
VILTLVPLTRIGIMLGHWMFGAPFTATLMIGFIALAGHHRPKTDTPFFIRFPNSPAIRITNASSINYLETSRTRGTRAQSRQFVAEMRQEIQHFVTQKTQFYSTLSRRSRLYID